MANYLIQKDRALLNEVIIDALFLIIKIYTIINQAERINTAFLKTLIIESECLIKL